MEVRTEELIAGIGVIIALGGVIVVLLKGVFMTKKDCKLMQDDCNAKICKKIDKLAADQKESERNIFTAIDHNRDVVMDKFMEIQKFMGRIEGKLSNKTG